MPRQPGVPAAESDRKEWRLERELVGGADVFADVVDAVAGANRGGVMTEEIVGQADARTKAGGVVVVVRGIAAGGLQAGQVQLIDATAVDEGILPGVRKLLIEISDMALVVLEGAELFDAQAEVQSKVRADFPVILRKEGEIVGAVLVIEDAAATEAAIGSAVQEFLEVGDTSGAGDPAYLGY